ncbi:restriction endonuclease subunit S [Vibrio diabolicus]|uniref:restriction endonuclease subunit S n=1 Tax=Vibrio diabolicus TaxID=50719 RepID=UPI003B5ABA0D
MSELPKGWVLSSIGEACLIENGLRKPISLKERANCQGIYPYYGATGIIDYLDSYTHEGEYVLIGEDGANLLSKSKALAFIADGQYWVNNHAHTLRSLAGSPNQYLERYFNSLSLERWVTGSAQPKLTKKNLESIPYPLAPLPEQKRIVEKLDEVLAQVDTIKARLDGIPDLLKRFRQSVLASAVSGKLTEEWRGGSRFVAKKYTLKDLTRMDIGHAFKSKEFSETGIRLLRGQNIEPGSLRWSETKLFPLEKLNSHQNLFINEGDIILAMDRPIVSAGLKLARAKKSDLPCVLVQRVARIKANELAEDDYVHLLLMDSSFSDYLFPNQTGSDIPHISGKQIQAYSVSIPDKKEQKEIVRLVDQYFAFADTIEAQVKKAQARVDNLTQSILAKAFRGELVPQDDDDEPAEVLLKRIAQARKEAEALAKAAKKVAKAKRQK